MVSGGYGTMGGVPPFVPISDGAGIIEEIGVDVRNGFGDVLTKIKTLSEDVQLEIHKEINFAFENGPSLAMVDSDKGITNLHVLLFQIVHIQVFMMLPLISVR